MGSVVVEIGCGALGVWDVVGAGRGRRRGQRGSCSCGRREFSPSRSCFGRLNGIRDSCRCLLERSGEYTVARCRYVE